MRYHWAESFVDEIDCGGGYRYQVHYDENMMRPRISSIVSSDGVMLTYAYSADGQLRSCTVGGVAKASYRYDELSRLTETRNGEGLTVTHVAYDASGNQIVDEDSIDTISDGTSVRKKLAGGRIISVTDESGAVADFAYRVGGEFWKRLPPRKRDAACGGSSITRTVG